MREIKPLNFIQSMLFFGCSALLFRICVYTLMPFLQSIAIADFWAFIISYTLPLTILVLATFVCLIQEGNLKHWHQRLRLNKLTFKQTLYCVGIFIAGFLLTGLLIPTAKYLASLSYLSPPDFLPDILNPNKIIPGKALTVFMGVPVKGAYWLVGVYFVFLTFFNILGEELWFRGYILPRQELTWKKNTWLYHGIFWCLFHVPIYPWAIIYLLPTTLTVSYAAQKFNSTWAGFIIHYLGNGLLALVPIILGVMQ
ncbi:MAG: CPBP family intramembrane metalloprotease [Verrucomicrobia bacterium]|nr:CPBP family intramembrane metalloprotease [Cytophagales bacterium]